MASLHQIELFVAQSMVGVIGAGVREAMVYDPALPVNWWKRGAGLVTGGTVAPTTALQLAKYLIYTRHWEMMDAVTLSVGLSFWIGIIAIGIVVRLLSGDFNPLGLFGGGK